MIRIFASLFALACLGLALVAGTHYEGHWIVYAVFTLTANALLFIGFRRQAIYFDTFIGIFLWLGFWLKLSLRVAFTAGQFHESVGAFDGSGAAFDHALTVASWGFGGLLLASFVRQRFFHYPATPLSCTGQGLFELYRTYRKTCIALFVVLVLGVGVSNIVLGIYQRGMVTQTVLPFGLNGIYKWLLQFGLSSMAALIIRFEIELQRNVSMVAIFPPLMECFTSNVSLLSRGMVLNSAALGLGGLRTVLGMNLRLPLRTVAVASITFAALFAASVLSVNYLRASSVLGEIYELPTAKSSTPTLAYDAKDFAESAKKMTGPLFIDRWVGIEGVMAVSSSQRLGWSLWKEAWQEKFQEGQLSLFDRYFIDSPYNEPAIDKTKHHFVSLPGVIAFFYYPGSMAFLFAGLFLLGLVAALFEFLSYRLAGQNWVLCSLLAQVVAFRYASFGYVPSQSHLLFGTVLLNVLLIAVADWMARRWMQPPHVSR
ncbi:MULTISPECIES: hypothetical protein [unclassified Hydrogenophaga]|uniref:hypothetical protein n=1 Tax=unclassified Hydrogenophaga TaxID=2610897 RepID=UPI000959E8AA|nr:MULTISPECIES: hypothetical protein [unclassified Hydrogenophaga]MBN9370265.1 hypothetical protein [Hydrogenophaga sp.]OJV36967.1 MAG: hypothetical protein BGO22_03755 [Hydrogenophaga sp. 70-12]